jgi:hypothetical protein
MWVLIRANPMKIVRGSNGICLAEFLIAATAGAVMLSAALQALDHFQGRLWNQIETIDRQQELRIGLKSSPMSYGLRERGRLPRARRS